MSAPGESSQRASLHTERVGARSAPTHFTYDELRAALYALSVGVTAEEARYLYEAQGETFRVLPTLALLATVPFLDWTAETLGVTPSTTLLGEQEMVWEGPLPPRGELVSHGELKALYDKGKGALAVTEVVTADEVGHTLLTTTLKIFVKGAGGFGGERGPKLPPVEAPDRPPEVVQRQTTWPNLAALYRLNGDLHPIHIDPAVAAAEGLERPPLHGMCTVAHAARAVIAGCCRGEPRTLRRLAVRYLGTVYPGDTLITSIWKEGDQGIFVTANQHGAAVLGNATASWGAPT